MEAAECAAEPGAAQSTAANAGDEGDPSCSWISRTSEANTELFASGLIARAELDRTETAVKVREREISETEAAIRVVSETGDREADLKAARACRSRE